MRHLYVCPLATWKRAHNYHLFHPVAGSHYVALSDGMIIVAAVLKDEACEEEFLGMEDVAALPDPTFEGNTTLAIHRDNPATEYMAKHHEALKAIGVEDTDTTLDVSKKTQAIHQLVKIAHIL